MPEITRRSLLAGATAAGLALTAAPGAVAARVARVPLTREEHRAVVIGSGFGGGVAALRLARAGVPVLLLERGIRWPTGPDAETFPHPTSPDRRVFWLDSTPRLDLFGTTTGVGFPRYTGLLERVAGKGMDILCAAGVGGGSLIYQGMSLMPSQAVFESCFPAGLDYRRMAAVHYPRVARMLRLRTAPDELIASPTYKAARVFGRNVERAGYTLEKIPMPIDWSYALRELRGEMRPSYTNGDGAFGVNNGGKHSVDVTYISAAEATGLVTLAVRHVVTGIALRPDGRWQVAVDRIATDGTVLEQKLIGTRALVLAAGQANTTRLLMRAAAKGDIPDLPDGLGGNWGSNGDRIYTWTSGADDFGTPQGGPVVYGSKDWADPARANTIIQASLPPSPNLRTTMLVGYGVSAGRGRFVYDATKDDAVLHWPKNTDDALYRVIHERISAVAGRFSFLGDTTALYPSTWHPLGGASIGEVCDLDGRVLGHRGLYVLDGALMPGTTAACNPSMTIAAVAERALDNLVRTDLGTAI